MTTGGWVFMLTSWALILGLMAFCLYRTVHPRTPPESGDAPQG